MTGSSVKTKTPNTTYNHLLTNFSSKKPRAKSHLQVPSHHQVITRTFALTRSPKYAPFCLCVYNMHWQLCSTNTSTQISICLIFFWTRRSSMTYNNKWFEAWYVSQTSHKVTSTKNAISPHNQPSSVPRFNLINLAINNTTKNLQDIHVLQHYMPSPQTTEDQFNIFSTDHLLVSNLLTARNNTTDMLTLSRNLQLNISTSETFSYNPMPTISLNIQYHAASKSSSINRSK